MIPDKIVFEGEDVKRFLLTLWDHGLQVANFDIENNFPDNGWHVYEKFDEDEDAIKVAKDG